MLPAAKEAISVSDEVCADLPLAAIPQLSENSPPGFATKNAALHLEQPLCNSTTALGIERGLLGNGIGESESVRYYDPNMGRFLGEDPLGDLAGPNHFTYVSNRPSVLVDPSGLAPTWWHRNRTLELANAILGPNCPLSAQIIADANAAEDAVHGVGGWVKFFLGVGPGWKAPGAHFPDAKLLQERHDAAFSTGSLEAFGAYLHSLQDAITHDTISPFDHWTHIAYPDYKAIWDLHTEDRALVLTAAELTKFRDQWLRYCKQQCGAR